MIRGCVCLFVFVIASSRLAAQTPQTPEQAPEHPGKKLLVTVCSACHGVETITEQPRTKAVWTDTIEQMIQFGANASRSDFDSILDYLLRNYSLINVNKAPAEDLQVALDVPEKVAKAIVEYRELNGDFKTIDDLKMVIGIDPVKLDARAKRIRYE